MNFKPSYLNITESEFLFRVERAFQLLHNCNVCPRFCKVNRFTSNTGFCQSGLKPIVSSYTAHFGEEPVISGANGAGNIFFGNCNMKCLYCQNFEISQNWKEEIKNEKTCEELADIMIELQNQNCHNIGLVSPTHFSPQILKAIFIAKQKGLQLPIIYNSNGFDSVEMLKLFDGVIDIYLPDLKYGDNLNARKYSFTPNYFDYTKEALKEMFRQVGDKIIYDSKIAVRGLIIRHLVLPNNLAETEIVLKFIVEELNSNVHISLMSQYYPSNKAKSFPLLNRKINYREYEKAVELLEKYGLQNGWIQEMDSPEFYLPNFENRNNPFGN